MRPLETQRQKSVVTELEDGKSVSITAPKSSAAYKNGEREETFHFASVFGPDATQETIFTEVARPILGSVMDLESDGLIFSFGVTNSGKSYTIHGTTEQEGIIPRCLRAIFNSINQLGPVESRMALDLSNYRYGVQVNYLEIYNELIYDLLADMDTQKESLQIAFTTRGQIKVSGLRDVTVATYEDAVKLLEQGKQARQVAETKLNTDSSRSHSIFTIKLAAVPKEHVVPFTLVQANPIKYMKHKRISIIDLAGSERAKRTNNQGARLVEANNINKSLLTFKLCIDALRHNQLHPSRPKPVPYRDSKMTRLFQDYFSGQGRAAMIVNVNPQVSDYDETSRVMKFSAIAQDVKLAVSRIDTGRVPGGKTRSRTDPGEANAFLQVTHPEEMRTAAAATASVAPTAAAVGHKGGLSSKAVAVKKGAASAADQQPQQQQPSSLENELRVQVEQLKLQLATLRLEATAQVDALQVELQNARLDSSDMRAQLVELEASIREEVASEMAQDIFRNQLQCEERVVEMREALEEKYERKIEILDELNRATQQRHATKYQELVDEWNLLADEKEALQKRLESLLAAKESGSDRKYNDLIKQLEAQITHLTQQVAQLENSKQEWKVKVGQVAEARIAQLEQENKELREENKQLKSESLRNQGDALAADRKRTARGKWGLKKKQKSVDAGNAPPDADEEELLDAHANEEEDGDWANISLDVNSNANPANVEKGGAKQQKKKFGSWRKRKGNNTSPVKQAPPEPVEVADKRATPNVKKHKAKQPSRVPAELLAPPPPAAVKSPVFADFAAAAPLAGGMGRQDSDSMRLTDLLVGGDAHQLRPSSPTLHKRSVSHASASSGILGKTDLNLPANNSNAGFVPVLVPAPKVGAATSTRARRAPTKNMF